MPVEDSTAVALTSLLLLGGVQLMDQLGPGMAEVRAADANDVTVRGQLNTAELVAGGTVLAAGVLVAVMARRWEPVAMAALVVTGSLVAYELAWRADSGTAIDPSRGAIISSS